MNSNITWILQGCVSNFACSSWPCGPDLLAPLLLGLGEELSHGLLASWCACWLNEHWVVFPRSLVVTYWHHGCLVWNSFWFWIGFPIFCFSMSVCFSPILEIASTASLESLNPTSAVSVSAFSWGWRPYKSSSTESIRFSHSSWKKLSFRRFGTC